MAREILRRSVPAAAASPWPDDFQRIVQQFFGDTDTTLSGAFSPPSTSRRPRTASRCTWSFPA
ncbi:hypothetical protein [Demequina sediminis]|uniref:hypothetical protein n=1 Tax=Demequina sediminis TaxID=1930058 RepID=UPI002573DA0F|nr:hypothetical protein [Demequina sediminis]